MRAVTATCYVCKGMDEHCRGEGERGEAGHLLLQGGDTLWYTLCEEQQREVNVSGWALSSAMPSDALYGGGAVLVGIEIRHVVTPR